MSKATAAAFALVVVLVTSGLALSLAFPRGTASPNPPAPAGTRSFTLYGDTTDGWGVTSPSVNRPGPTLTVIEGDVVTIHLYSNDSFLHNWFVDFNGDLARSAGEPSSPDFNSPTVAVNYTFTVPTGHLGSSTYRCRLHPTSMTGTIIIQAPQPAPTFSLYGDSSGGWGLTPGSIDSPGPTLNVTQGQAVTIDLYAADGASHTFYIDWTGNGAYTPGSEVRVNFNSTTEPVRYSFNATIAGNFTYYCSIHPLAMYGTIHVAGTGGSTPTPPAPDYVLYAAVVIVVVVAAAAVGLLVKRKPRVPPQQPPAQP